MATEYKLSYTAAEIDERLSRATIISSGAPTTTTVGAVGAMYMDTDNGTLYKCIAVTDGEHIWEEIGGGLFVYISDDGDGQWGTRTAYADALNYYNHTGHIAIFIQPVPGNIYPATGIELSDLWDYMTLHSAAGVFQWNQDGTIEKIREPESGDCVKSVNGQTPDENGNVQIEVGGVPEGAVLYTEQDLTPEQQAQARANIGAMELAYEVDYHGNILPFNMVGDVYSAKGVTITHENGVFTFNGTATGGASVEIIPKGTAYATLQAGQPYYYGVPVVSDGMSSGNTSMYIHAGENAAEILYQGNISLAAPRTYDEDKTLTRFTLTVTSGVTYTNHKVAPYVGTSPIGIYAGGDKKQIEIATAESVAQLESKMNLLPTQFIEERNRVVPIAQGYNADLRLIAFADPHSFDENKYRKYNDLLSSGCIDSIVGLGDYQSYSVHERAATISNITKALSHAGRTPNCFYAIGNHDIAFTSSNSGEVTQDTVLTKREMHDCLGRHLNGVAHFNDTDPYGGYYYVDYTAAKIRLVVINTSDIYEADGSLAYKYTESVMIQQPQVTWFVNDALDFSNKTDPSKWSVLVCCHSAFISTMFTDILTAVKNGTDLSKTWTFTRRLLNDGTSAVDQSNPVSISASKEFSKQGAVDVIGVLYGHDHHNITTISNGISFVGFISDNGKLDDYYVANVNGLTAGSYCFTAKNGSKFGFTLSEAVADAAVFGYNHYLVSTGNTTIRFQNADGVTVKETRAKTADYVEGMTEITGFVQERTLGTIEEESCVIVNIDKDAREIRIVPYGVGENRVIAY